MKLHYSLERGDEAPLVLAIGFFDGMHRGHYDIARRVRMLRQPGWSTGVLTFANHPAAFLRPGSEPPLITTPEERIDLLAKAGYDECFFVPFDERIANQTPAAFLRETLIERLGVRGVAVGSTFRFGRGREGDADLMRATFEKSGIAFTPVENTTDESGTRISSTRIRDLGKASRAARRPWN